MSRCSRGVRFLVLAAAATMVAACTLASGWSDLQGGASEGGVGKPPKNEAGLTEPDGDKSDTSVPGNDGSVTDGVPCGAQTCRGQIGCCVSLAQQTKSCMDRATCNPGATRYFLLCAHGGQCPSDRPNCCLHYGADRWDGTCQNGCAAGDEVLCDRTQGTKHCMAGEQCDEFTNAPGFFSCQ